MRQRVKTILFIGLALIALFGMTACPQKAKPKAEEPAPPPGPQKVTFSVEGTPANGELKAMAGSTPITSGKKVPYGTTVTFTATVTAAEHYADEWTIKGGSFKTGGKDGDTTATVQITGETEVKVNFSRYKSVAFGTDGSELDAYLNSGTPAADGIYYIKVTGLKAEHLKGDYNIGKPSPLAKILKDNGTKKVALKFGKLPAVTDMTACFSDCKNLIKAPELPSTVTTMESCFYECKGLTQAPEIPESVTNMGNCFNDCTNLTQISPFPANAKVTNMNGCFVECENLTQVPALPASVTDITNCFKKCKNLTQAPEIPASVTQMTNCFYECVKLTKAPSTIPKGVTNLHSCFFNCRKLTKAPVIPKSVTYMKYCFKFCGELTEVTLECNYVNDDFKEAFFSCNKLTAGTIKVPADQVDAYKAGADDMGTQPDRFVAAP
ncbi:leucine-rich repeat domain-containing protein [Treponema denticola]|uniref:leucine-rich repeat domain-containing protein n=1 Tax=Treponema denticola TaxID=158 RepID=UPI0020A2B1F1|nr:leucine-rich repeat domain-containing protein [Treponema denticola]UTC84154.1 leucine-rich repeat domain-containing protein [Treponema denticola]